jgi:hypothetical protein
VLLLVLLQPAMPRLPLTHAYCHVLNAACCPAAAAAAVLLLLLLLQPNN